MAHLALFSRFRRLSACLAALLLVLACTDSLNAEPVSLHCRWIAPVCNTPLEWTFPGPALLSAAENNVTVLLPAGCRLRTIHSPVPASKIQAVQTDKNAWTISVPDIPGAYPLTLITTDTPRKLCIYVPHRSIPGSASHGTIRVNGTKLGPYPDPRKSGIEKVKLHASAYAPPRLFWTLAKPFQDYFVSPSIRLKELAQPQNSKSKHTDVVPVCYPLLAAIKTLRSALSTQGIPPQALRLISVFRAPGYNRKNGYSRFSRHAYGDAFDFIIDADKDGRMDDLTGDGRVNATDGLWIVALIEDLQAANRLPMGGIGVYTFAHGKHPVSMHLDIRGHRATWAYRHDRTGKRTEFSWKSRHFAAQDNTERTHKNTPAAE